MADETKTSFDELSDQGKEAVTPRGEYLNPEALDQGTGYPGAPKGNETPESVQTDAGFDPNNEPAPARRGRKAA